MFVVGYYNELTVVRRLILGNLFFYTMESITFFLLINRSSMLIALNVLSTFKLNLDCTEVLSFQKKVDLLFMQSRRKQGQKVLYHSKKSKFTTVISHANSNKSNNLNAPNSNNLIVASNLPHSNVQNEILFDTLINLQKVTDTQSIASINDEITCQNNISEEV